MTSSSATQGARACSGVAATCTTRRVTGICRVALDGTERPQEEEAQRMDTRRDTHDGTKQDDSQDPVKGTDAQTDRPVTPDTTRDQGEAIDRDAKRKRTDDAKGSQR